MCLPTTLHGVTSFKSLILVELILRMAYMERNFLNIWVAVSRLTGHRGFLVDAVRRTVLSRFLSALETAKHNNCELEPPQASVPVSSKWFESAVTTGRLPAHRDRQFEACWKKSWQSRLCSPLTVPCSRDPGTCVKACPFQNQFLVRVCQKQPVYFNRNIQFILSLLGNLKFIFMSGEQNAGQTRNMNT